jgi:hypothetical protein
MRWIVILLSSFVIFGATDKHLNAHGPFGKRHSIKTEPSPYACNRTNGLLFPSTTEIISSLNVSATVYSSNEQIIVTWIPISISCKDDFIGVYFVDIPLAAGKYVASLHFIHMRK